ncbi:hypothetical protein ABZ250_19580 [Streptomyces afghaniensis]|uniref:hypothetical protein n=1 Tax=Streptomyces afghaniensis TaxID=66865 RepID=UPI0033AAAB26
MLTEHGDLPIALGSWEQRLRPLVTRYQKEALCMRHFFMPANRFGHIARSTLIRAASTPADRRGRAERHRAGVSRQSPASPGHRRHHRLLGLSLRGDGGFAGGCMPVG